VTEGLAFCSFLQEQEASFPTLRAFEPLKIDRHGIIYFGVDNILFSRHITQKRIMKDQDGPERNEKHNSVRVHIHPASLLVSATSRGLLQMTLQISTYLSPIQLKLKHSSKDRCVT
jgi:hypothetical protein